MNDYQCKFSDDSLNLKSSLNASGRFSFQREEMKRIVPEILNKLEIKPNESLLDIGCNCGDITIPLSFMCDKVTVIDGAGSIKRIKQRTEDYDNFEYLEGDFLSIDISKKFDCILAYSVLMYVEPFEKKKEFVLKAAGMLKEGGRLLVGDIVNIDRKNRFAKSSKGKEIDAIYKENILHLTKEDVIKSEHVQPVKNILSDIQLMDLLLEIREKGYESYLLPQNPQLPFGYTRDDILVRAW
ncbi:MAG: class I SAM-dependent methyltransferase [Lachnospiraceae bacterium]|nr:class I SAM-dependent methyltransferase [Lachnospiraceae bacterium]